jgi:hypothetical protein
MLHHQYSQTRAIKRTKNLTNSLMLMIMFSFSPLLLLSLVSVVNGQDDTVSTSCLADADASLEAAIELDQKVTTLHLLLPSFWCDGTLPSDFVFTIEPMNDDVVSNSSNATTSRIYTLPALQSPLLLTDQTATTTEQDDNNGTITTTTTIVTLLSENTVFSRPGSFGVVIQVPANDLETVIIERSLFWNQNTLKVRIAPGFARLSRIVSQTIDPFQDEQGIELEADVSSTSNGVTLDLMHHGRYHVKGNVHALNVQQHSTARATVTNSNTVVQILGNVHMGNITRAGTYSILGNITGSLSKVAAATLTTTTSCDNVIGNGDDGDASCDTVTMMSDETMGAVNASSPPFFSLQCSRVVCRESGASLGGDEDDVKTCHLLTSCPVFGQPIRVNKNAELMAPESGAVPRGSRFELVVVLAAWCWWAVGYVAS